jgi:hypothetical protein
MFKMNSHDPFEYLKHKLWLKEGPGVKLAIWLSITKSQELPRFPCVQVACYIPLESSQWGLQLCFRLHSIKGLKTKLWAPKVVRVPTLGISRVPKQNVIWVLVPWLGTEYTIRGKVVASPKSGPWWVLWIFVCLWLVRAPKCSNYALTNLLFGLCKFVWVIELLINLPNPILKFKHAPKCCEPKSAPQVLFLPLSSPLDSQLNPSRSLGVCHLVSIINMNWNYKVGSIDSCCLQFLLMCDGYPNG